MTSGAKDVAFVSNCNVGLLAEKGRGGSGKQIVAHFARATSQWPVHIVTLPILPGAESTPAGAHQMEPPSPIQALGINPFPSRFIIRTVPRGDFAR